MHQYSDINQNEQNGPKIRPKIGPKIGPKMDPKWTQNGLRPCHACFCPCSSAAHRSALAQDCCQCTVVFLWSGRERWTTAPRCGPRSSMWCHCPLLRVNCKRMSRPHRKDWGFRLWRRTWKKVCTESNRRRLGKAKHLNTQHLWKQEASKSGKFVTKKVGMHVNPVDLMTKPLRRPDIEQLMHVMSHRFVEQYKGQSELHHAESACPKQTAQ